MNKLKFWRLERGLSQFELADSCSIPRHVIQLSEQGLRRPNPEQQLAMAAVLNVSARELFPEIPIPEDDRGEE